MKIHLLAAELFHTDRWMDRQNEAMSLSKIALQKHQQIAHHENTWQSKSTVPQL